MSRLLWMLIGIIIVVWAIGVNSVPNVTARPAEESSAKTMKALVKKLQNFIQIPRNSDNARDSQPNILGSQTGSMLIKILQNPINKYGSLGGKDNRTNSAIPDLLNWMEIIGNQRIDINEKTNATDALLRKWTNILGSTFKDMVSVKELESFLLNADTLDVLRNIGQDNLLKDGILTLFQKTNLLEWLAPLLSLNPSSYHGLPGLFTQQSNSSTMAQLTSMLGPTLQIYSGKLLNSVRNEIEGMNISSRCSNETVKILTGILSGQAWALRYLDAMGKPQPGLLEGALFWPGSFHECLNIVSPEAEASFKGNYCLLKFPIPSSIMQGMAKAQNTGANPEEANGIAAAISANVITLQYGACLPNSCSTEDVGIMINKGLMDKIPQSWYGNNTSSVQPVCHTEQDFKQDTRAVVVVCVLACLGFIIFLGTTYDVITLLMWQHRRPCKIVETMSSEMKRSESFPVDNSRIKMSNEKDTETSLGVYVMADSTTENGIIHEPEVISNGSPHKAEVDSTSDVNLAKRQIIAKHDEKERRPKPGIVGGLLLSFSLYTNTQKLVSTEARAGSLGAIHGARFFSMTWVLLGHAFGSPLSIANNAIGYTEDFTKRWTAQGITNALVSVDSFFTLSGLLVSYLTLKEMAKAKSAKINWFMYYFHRFWRLTPPYMLILLTSLSLFQYWGIGPQWLPRQMEPETCNTHWWKNLLYINNFKEADACMGHTWYLANDMQFYVISPLILVPLFYSKILGLTILALFFLATFITTGVISYVNGFKPFDMRPGFMDKMYVKPWCRIGPYLAGMLVGYILFKTKCKPKLHWSTVMLGWCFAIVTCLATLYGLYGESHGYPLTNEASAVYNALHRTAWGAGLGWLLFACITGYGGIINTFLSWKAFIPLARLTYMTYLTHPMIMVYFGNTAQGPFNVTDITISYIFVGHLFFAYLVSFIISLSFEAPFVGLERVIFRRN